MANVLPPEVKKTRDRAMWSRVVLLVSIVLIVGVLVALLSLAPAYISLQISSDALEASAASQAPGGDQAIAARTQALSSALLPIATSTSSPSTILAHALSLRPTGIAITSAVYTTGKIMLRGTASRREAVNEYRTALDADNTFVQVLVPVAALVGTEEGKFTITLTGAF